MKERGSKAPNKCCHVADISEERPHEGDFVFARATLMGSGGSALGCAYRELSYPSDAEQSEEPAAVCYPDMKLNVDSGEDTPHAPSHMTRVGGQK